MGIGEEKGRLRAEFRRIRRQIPVEKRDFSAQAASKRIFALDFYRKSDKILVYVSHGDELGTEPLIHGVLADGKQLFVPRCDPVRPGSMSFYRICDPALDLRPGKFGILEPCEHCDALAGSAGLCIVPGLAFSADGYRLGGGGGYYDRFLSHFSGAAVGFCFSEQITSDIPQEETDRPVCAVVTPEALILPD